MPVPTSVAVTVLGVARWFVEDSVGDAATEVDDMLWVPPLEMVGIVPVRVPALLSEMPSVAPPAATGDVESACAAPGNVLDSMIPASWKPSWRLSSLPPPRSLMLYPDSNCMLTLSIFTPTRSPSCLAKWQRRLPVQGR